MISLEQEKIAVIRQMHDHEHKTFRAIAAELGISKSQAQRLHGLGSPRRETGHS